MAETLKNFTVFCPLCKLEIKDGELRCKEYQKDNKLWITHFECAEKQKAQRLDLGIRYDLLLPEFLRAMARIGQYGAEKYGEPNYQKSRMTGKDGPPNHILAHLNRYMLREGYDHEAIGTDRKYHLAAIAFNAMMEWFYEEHFSSEDNSNN